MFKVCPSCAGEFQQWVTQCPDCGVPLQIGGPGGGAAPQPARAAADELPPARELACLQRGDPRALHEIAERLQAEGISCRIDAYPPDEPIRVGARRGAGVATTFGLYVRESDAARGAAVREQLLHETVPDAEGSALGAELSACPACGEPLAEGAGACAGCGLEFPDASTQEGSP
jgi:hypothetical protein